MLCQLPNEWCSFQIALTLPPDLQDVMAISYFDKQSPSSTYLSHFVLFVHNNKLLLFNYILQSLIFTPINTWFDSNYFIDLIKTANLPIIQNFNFSKFSLALKDCQPYHWHLLMIILFLPVTKLSINQWYVLLYCSFQFNLKNYQMTEIS